MHMNYAISLLQLAIHSGPYSFGTNALLLLLMMIKRFFNYSTL